MTHPNDDQPTGPLPTKTGAQAAAALILLFLLAIIIGALALAAKSIWTAVL